MARKALGRGLGALIPNAEKLLQSTKDQTDDELAAPLVEDAAKQVDASSAADGPVPPGRVEEPVDVSGEAEAASQPPTTTKQTNGIEGPSPPAPAGTPAPGGAPATTPTFPAGPPTDQGTAATVRRDDRAEGATPQGRRALASGRASAVIEIALDRIAPNPYQPRADFNEDELEELVRSIDQRGVLQPVLVRRRGVGYELIAGERRLRAARRARMNTIPAIVRDADDEDMLELAIIENQLRVDLNPIEAAEAYSRAVQEFGLSTEELADVLGRDRSTVANFLRLLALPKEVQDLVRKGDLQMGHARALVGVKDPALCTMLARRAVRSGLSVRAVEQLSQGPRRKASRARRVDPELQPFEDRLRRRFATQVRILRRGNRGRLEIEFYNQSDLERILEELNVLSDR